MAASSFAAPMWKRIPKGPTVSRGARSASTNMSVQVQPLAHLIDESFEEAAFLWSRWEADLASISRNLDEVWSWTEDRLSGALDGVRLAPDAALERLVETAVSAGKPLELTVCGHVLANAAAPGARALLLRSLSAATGRQLRALMRGIE